MEKEVKCKEYKKSTNKMKSIKGQTVKEKKR